MTIVVGVAPNQRGHAALNLAAVLARSSGEPLVVCAVIPTGWGPQWLRASGPDLHYLDEAAEDALEQARAHLPADITVQVAAQRARSVASGLAEIAERHRATALVLGSARTGMIGHIALSSVADRLLHSSTVPVALAPRGFRAGTGTPRIVRVTVAYDGSEQAEHFVRAADAIAAAMQAKLRLASFAVQLPPPATARMNRADEGVMDEWTGRIRASVESLYPPGPAGSSTAPEFVVGYSHDWAGAIENIDWEPTGELLVLGSSHAEPLERVFLGTHASKIIRQSPVPVLALPGPALTS
ncbi:universal stress protein [Intrasporangium sp.]|uniref:universal stress protein n=1 Tax=Intrasporangium sp. TaxID=1925024 RepID=UPI003221DEB5